MDRLRELVCLGSNDRECLEWPLARWIPPTIETETVVKVAILRANDTDDDAYPLSSKRSILIDVETEVI